VVHFISAWNHRASPHPDLLAALAVIAIALSQVFDAEAVRGHETLQLGIDEGLPLAGDIGLSFPE